MVADTPLPFDWPTQDNAPDRPALHDDEVMQLAAEMAADRIIAEWHDGGYEVDDHEDIVEALLDVFCEHDHDGYTLASKLESRRCWSPDALLVDILDRGYLSDARSTLIEKWVSIYGIKPSLKIGDKVKSPYGVGEITTISEKTAQYIIDTGRNKTYVEYEKVTPLAAPSGDAARPASPPAPAGARGSA